MRALRITTTLASLLLAALSVAPASAAPRTPRTTPYPPLVVQTDKGAVRGESRAESRLFQGIPYAQPPTGDRRWQSPKPARAWSGVRDARRPGNACPQPVPAYEQKPVTAGEDCLNLNVTTPDGSSGRRLPVMVWVHGGSNITGSGSTYDPAALAARGDVVVVSLNYRLGALGWLGHPGFESGHGRRGRQAGNYGLLDQQAAFRWVRRNIAAFGGDPGNVTLFGESAGSQDICAHLVSPASAGLLHKVIAQSYSCTAPARTEHEAQDEATRFAAAVGCGGAETPADRVTRCLRALPADRLVKAFQSASTATGPVAGGGGVLPLQPREALEKGRFSHVPVLHGNTLDEFRLFVAQEFPKPITAARYERFVRDRYGARADAILARYPAAAYPEPRIALATLLTDSGTPLSTCLHLDAFHALRRSGVPVYAYQFADRDAPPLVDVPGFDEGAEHATELSYVFPGLLGDLDPAQQRLSDTMIGYWTSFAHRGRPEAQHAPHWPKFRTSDDVLTLAPGHGGIHPADTAGPSNCAFWKTSKASKASNQ
jgi:para-nitrobenzyl esterase